MILITNNVDYHYEIIVHIIEKYDIILSIPKQDVCLECKPNPSFLKYIREKYPNVRLEVPPTYDYLINCTIYPQDIIDIAINKYYISHRVFETLNPNIFFLTPLKFPYLCCDALPFKDEKIKNPMPIYIVQGNVDDGRKKYELLDQILAQKYDHDFRIKIIGRGKMHPRFHQSDKIIFRHNLDFIDYHKEFLDGYAILPLITKSSHPQYYTKQLPSSINYGLAYNLHFIIDEDLQNIFQLENASVFKDDIVSAFKKSLDDFYKKKRFH